MRFWLHVLLQFLLINMVFALPLDYYLSIAEEAYNAKDYKAVVENCKKVLEKEPGNNECLKWSKTSKKEVEKINQRKKQARIEEEKKAKELLEKKKIAQKERDKRRKLEQNKRNSKECLVAEMQLQRCNNQLMMNSFSYQLNQETSKKYIDRVKASQLEGGLKKYAAEFLRVTQEIKNAGYKTMDCGLGDSNLLQIRLPSEEKRKIEVQINEACTLRE